MFGTDSKNWHPQPKIYKSPPYSVEVPSGPKQKGETVPRRNLASKSGLIERPEEGIDTVYDLLTRASNQFGNAKAVGWRTLIRHHEETKKVKKVVDGKEQMVDKKWTFYEQSPYKYMSFIEYERLAMQVGAGLRKLGMTSSDKLHLFAATRCALLCCSKKIRKLTLYPTALGGLPCHTVCPALHVSALQRRN